MEDQTKRNPAWISAPYEVTYLMTVGTLLMTEYALTGKPKIMTIKTWRRKYPRVSDSTLAKIVQFGAVILDGKRVVRS